MNCFYLFLIVICIIAGVEQQRQRQAVVGGAGLGIQLLCGRAVRAGLGLAILRHQRRVFPLRWIIVLSTYYNFLPSQNYILQVQVAAIVTDARRKSHHTVVRLSDILYLTYFMICKGCKQFNFDSIHSSPRICSLKKHSFIFYYCYIILSTIAS